VLLKVGSLGLEEVELPNFIVFGCSDEGVRKAIIYRKAPFYRLSKKEKMQILKKWSIGNDFLVLGRIKTG
jgi:hypothetical protein